MTVLVLARELDPTADQVVQKLTARQVPLLRLDTAWFPQQLTLDAELRNGQWTGRLHTAHQSAQLEELRSIWYRSPTTFQFPPEMSEPERSYAHREGKLGLGGVLSSLPVLWVNHPNRLADALYKPTQLVVAARCGMGVPRTLITNAAGAARRFVTNSRTGVVTKALGTSTVVENETRKFGWTRRLTADDLADLEGIDVTAHQVQDWVDKAHEARVILVGEQLFAVAIHAGSDAAYVDWRSDYHALTYEVVEPPPVVAAALRAFMSEMRLAYAAVDFVITSEGRWVFLEANPGGNYGWLEASTELPISAALAGLLAAGRPS